MKKMPVGAAAALLIATALPVIGAGAAQASDDEVIRRGSCSGGTDWKTSSTPVRGNQTDRYPLLPVRRLADPSLRRDKARSRD